MATAPPLKTAKSPAPNARIKRNHLHDSEFIERVRSGMCAWCGVGRVKAPTRRKGEVCYSVFCSSMCMQTMYEAEYTRMAVVDALHTGLLAFFQSVSRRLDEQPGTAWGGTAALLNGMQLDLREGKGVSLAQLRRWAFQARRLLRGEDEAYKTKLTKEAAQWLVEGALRRGGIFKEEGTKREVREKSKALMLARRIEKVKSRVEKSEARAVRKAESIASGKRQGRPKPPGSQTNAAKAERKKRKTEALNWDHRQSRA